jgi:hypothetical protein
MMTTANEHELGPQGGAGHDQDQEQEAVTRAARMLGLWAAGLMGLESPHLEDYAEAVIRYAGAHADGEAILRKIAQDLTGAGLKFNEDQVRGKHDECLAVARGQVQAEG